VPLSIVTRLLKCSDGYDIVLNDMLMAACPDDVDGAAGVHLRLHCMEATIYTTFDGDSGFTVQDLDLSLSNGEEQGNAPVCGRG